LRDGDSVYSRENLHQILETPEKCVWYVRELLCENLLEISAVLIILSLISSVCGNILYIIYIYTHICVCIHVYIFMYIYRCMRVISGLMCTHWSNSKRARHTMTSGMLLRSTYKCVCIIYIYIYIHTKHTDRCTHMDVDLYSTRHRRTSGMLLMSTYKYTYVVYVYMILM